MKNRMSGGGLAIVVLGLCAGAAGLAAGGAKSVVIPREEVKWTAGAVPGVSSAAVEGDMAKGASHFYLKYASGFVSPPHHHSPDHEVTTITGTLVLTVDGKEHRLGPGSYFSLHGKAPHVARCEGTEDCVMFIHAHGPWDVVLEGAAKPKP